MNPSTSACGRPLGIDVHGRASCIHCMALPEQACGAIIHLRRMINDTTGEALPFCSSRIVPRGRSSSWMNQVTCEACRKRWRETCGVDEIPPLWSV